MLNLNKFVSNYSSFGTMDRDCECSVGYVLLITTETKRETPTVEGLNSPLQEDLGFVDLWLGEARQGSMVANMLQEAHKRSLLTQCQANQILC